MPGTQTPPYKAQKKNNILADYGQKLLHKKGRSTLSKQSGHDSYYVCSYFASYAGIRILKRFPRDVQVSLLLCPQASCSDLRPCVCEVSKETLEDCL